MADEHDEQGGLDEQRKAESELEKLIESNTERILGRPAQPSMLKDAPEDLLRAIEEARRYEEAEVRLIGIQDEYSARLATGFFSEAAAKGLREDLERQRDAALEQLLRCRDQTLERISEMTPHAFGTRLFWELRWFCMLYSAAMRVNTGQASEENGIPHLVDEGLRGIQDEHRDSSKAEDPA